MVDKLFVLVHVAAGLLAVVAGAAAMLAAKGSRSHRRRGLTYLGALAVVCASGAGLAILRWPRFPHLLALAVLAAALAGAGYVARRRPSPALHLLGMSASYVVMLTAFYVDNGPRLPGWRLLPPAAYWVLPSLVALPLVVRALRRHGRARSSHLSSGEPR
jgi:uncharacterized membrane protein